MKKLKVQIETKNLNYVTQNVIECVNFWDRNGDTIIAKNISGEYGNEVTKREAETKTRENFILDGLMKDVKIFVNSETAKTQLANITFEFGRTSSHIWVHENNNRVLMIYFE